MIDRLHVLPVGAAVVGVLGTAFSVDAQTEYRNTDGGHPLRIEDADASPRHSLEFQLAPLRLDRIIGGYYRWQLRRFLGPS